MCFSVVSVCVLVNSFMWSSKKNLLNVYIICTLPNYWKAQVPYENLENILRFMAKINTIDQGSENYGLWTKSALSLIFVSKVLLQHSHARLFMDCLWLFSDYNSRVEELWKTVYLKIFTIQIFTQKFPTPVLDVSIIFIYSFIYSFNSTLGNIKLNKAVPSVQELRTLQRQVMCSHCHLACNTYSRRERTDLLCRDGEGPWKRGGFGLSKRISLS